jgi:signal transduction histidine kinase
VANQTALQQELTKVLDDAPLGVGLIASSGHDGESIVTHAYRGLMPRELQALLRSIPLDAGATTAHSAASNYDSPFRLRIAAPTHKWMVGTLFKNGQQASLAVLIGRKTGAEITKKEQTTLKGLTKQVVTLLGSNNGHAAVGVPSVPADASTTPAMSGMTEVLQELLQFDQSWVSQYVIETTSVRVTHTFVPGQPEPKIGQEFPLDASASGWVVRHNKPRVDVNLASTQGRFIDQCPLYKQKYKSMMVLPLRVDGRVVGTLSVASKLPDQYSRDQVPTLDGVARKLAAYLTQVRDVAVVPAPSPPEAEVTVLGRMQGMEDLRRILASDVRRPLAAVHTALTDMMSLQGLSADVQDTVERVAHKVGRLGDVLFQVLEYGKPLKLTRTPCQIIPLIEEAVSFVHEDLSVKNIQIVPEYHTPLPLFRCDKAKIKSALISLLRCAEEMIQAAGAIHIAVIAHATGLLITLECQREAKRVHSEALQRQSEAWISFPIASQIIEEHGGKISVASGPMQATTIVIHLPIKPTRPSRGRRR